MVIKTLVKTIILIMAMIIGMLLVLEEFPLDILPFLVIIGSLGLTAIMLIFEDLTGGDE